MPVAQINFRKRFGTFGRNTTGSVSLIEHDLFGPACARPKLQPEGRVVPGAARMRGFHPRIKPGAGFSGSCCENKSAKSRSGRKTAVRAIVAPHRQYRLCVTAKRSINFCAESDAAGAGRAFYRAPATPIGRSANDRSYFFFDLQTAAGHMPPGR
jgi:hypothetical protein